MLDKATRLAKCLRSQVSEKLITQDKPCNQPPFAKFKASCRGCEKEESCGFMGLRGFKLSKKTGNLLHGPYFPSTKKYNPLQKLKSLRFNTKPPTKKSPSYAINKIKSTFHDVLLRQKDALKNPSNVPIRRENPEGDRHYCDSCFTGLFNYHFVCSTCALEICPDCNEKLTTTSDDALLNCTKGEKHLKEEFVLISKLPEDSITNLIQNTTPESIISNTDTNNKAIDNNNCVNKKYHNQTHNQHSNNSAGECANDISGADIQFKNNNKMDTNENPSTVNNAYQSEPISTPTPGCILNSYNSLLSSSQQVDTSNTLTNAYHSSQQVDDLNDNTKSNINTYPQQTQKNPIEDSMDVDTLGFGTGNMFEPCYINNIKVFHTGESGTYVLPSALGSTEHQGLNSNDGLMELPPELFYEKILFNQTSHMKRPPQVDFSSSNTIRRKRRGIDNNYLSYHYSNTTSGDFYMDITRQSNNCSQMPQETHYIPFTPPIPPLPSTPVHYVYLESQPYDLLSGYQDYELLNDFSGYMEPKTECASRVIKTPKSRRPFLTPPLPQAPPHIHQQTLSSSQVPYQEPYKVHYQVHYQDPSVLTSQPLSLSPTPAPFQISSSSTPVLSQTSLLSQTDPRMLNITASALTTESFRSYWQSHQPAMISESTNNSTLKWTPAMFEGLCKEEILEATDIDGTRFEVSGKDYFAAFSDRVKRKELCSALGSTEVLKIKDLPPNKSLKAEYPDLYHDFMKTLVASEYCTADGYFNLANRLPEEYLPPDLGPKLFISYGSDETGKTGRTNLHCDMTDAVNVMYYADNKTSTAIPVAAALWHIFPYDCLEKVGSYISDHKDIGTLHPILDHAFYLDEKDLKALKEDYDVVPFTLCQNPGDTVFIPAGCAHQVKNYSNSIKCAFDFISPENVDRSVYISECFRSLKKEDKLQIALTLAFAWESLKSDEV